MKPGYLSIETNEERKGLVRLLVAASQPDAAAPHAVRRIRYTARFNDSEAALMHSHELLKRRLLDPDAHLYRCPLERAIAAVESLGLRYNRVYLDAGLSDAQRSQIAFLSERYRARRRQKELIFQTLGYIALLILLLNLFVLSSA